MKTLVNVILSILFIIGVAALVVTIARWYRRLRPGKRRLYRMLFLAYVIMLLVIGL